MHRHPSPEPSGAPGPDEAPPRRVLFEEEADAVQAPAEATPAARVQPESAPSTVAAAGPSPEETSAPAQPNADGGAASAAPVPPKSESAVRDSLPSLDGGSSEYLHKLAALHEGLPEVDVKLVGVSLTARVIEDAGRRFEIPGLASALLGDLVCRRCRAPRVEKRILEDVNLHFAPGTSTLIMGPPSSGTSSLLKTIAGLQHGQLRGEVLCNGRPTRELLWRKLVSFCGQYDVQFADATAQNVLDFTSRTLYGVGVLSKLGLGRLERAADREPSTLVRLLGLTGCKDTVVGDEFTRGVSGGEKKRISIGEALCGPARVLLLDKYSTGLDSAMTLLLTRFLTEWARALRGVVVAHLLQPDPQVIHSFDQLVVLERGRVIFSGPPSAGLAFFSSAGLECPAGKDLGSFFSDVAVPENRALYSPAGKAFATEQMVEFYARSAQGQRVRDELGAAAGPAALEPRFPKSAFNHTMYGQSSPMSGLEQFWFLLRYHFRNSAKNLTFVVANIMQQVFMGLFIGWLFFQGDKTDFVQKYGLVMMVFNMLNNAAMPLIMLVLDQRPMTHKQLDRGCFGPGMYIVTYTLQMYSIQLVQTIIFGTIVYFMHGFTTSHIKHYFLHLVVLFLTFVDFSSMFTIFFYLIDTMGSIMNVVSILDIFLTGFCGYTITRNVIPKWLIEFYYMDPITYTMRGLVVNEFASADYKLPDKNNRTGIDFLNAFDMPHSLNDLWLDIFMLLFFHLLFVFLQIMVLRFRPHDPFPFSAALDSAVELKPLDDAELKSTLSRASSSRNDSDFQSVVFSFRDIGYSVTVKNAETKKREEKVLLEGVSGFVRPGSVTALMGASGAGKTTLLDVIANRKTAGRVTGRCLINGAPFAARDLAQLSGYVEQGDTLPSTETVREALRFSASLRMLGRPSREAVERQVSETIATLGLESYADMMIGELGSGLPMGIRKLVMLGIELAANPSLIFLDEPTTGLDSSAALAVVQTLQRIAATGRSIICTIHQPSFEIFSLFSDILLLERGGRVVYFGATGASGASVVKYVETLPGVHACGADENPSSYILEVTGAGIDSSLSGGGVSFGGYYRKSDLCGACERSLDEFEASATPVRRSSAYASSYCRQVSEVTQRFLRTAYRRLDLNVPRLRYALIVAVVYGLLYLQLNMNTNGAVQSAIGLVMSIPMSVGFSCGMTLQPVLFSIRSTFYRESAMRTYHPTALWIATLVGELLYVALVTVLLCAIMYPLVGLRGGFVWWLLFAATMMMWLMTVVIFSIFLSFAMPSIPLAQMVLGMMIGGLLTPCSGLVIPYGSMRAPWSWVYWVNPMMYCMQSMIIDQFPCLPGDCPSFPFSGVQITVQDYLVLIYSIRFDKRLLMLAGQLGCLGVGLLISLAAIWKVRFLNR